MSTLYGARPLPSGSQSARSSSTAPPRFEFGHTNVNRPEQFVSMTLRTQPQSYPHQTPAAAAATMPRPSPPLSARPASAASNHTPRGQAGRPHSAVRPQLDDDAVRDRYLPPSRSRPYTAQPPSMLALPHSYAHVPGGGTFPHSESEYLAAQGPGPESPTIVPMPSEHSIAYAAGQLQPAPHIPQTNQSALFTHVDPRARIGGGNPTVRDFMSTPAYFSFLAAREAQEQREEEEKARAAAAGLKGSSSRKMQRHKAGSADAAAGSAAQQHFTPSIPYPARFASAQQHAVAASSSSAAPAAAAAAASTPAPSALRIPTTLGLHERTLDVLQVLRSLKGQLDSCFELVRIEEAERRRRETKAAQTATVTGATNPQASRSVTPGAATPAPMQFIQAGHVSIPNTPNVTSQTLALLMHTPVLSAKRNAAIATPAEEAPAQQPTFLTDEAMESHALSNLSAAQRRTIFGGSVRVTPAAAAEEKEKELPFDRDDLDTHPDQPTHARPAARKLGASTREAPTTDLPERIVYTDEMCREFEESVRHWGAFLLASASTAAAASSASSAAAAAAAAAAGGMPSPNPNPNEDLILVLNDACAKYCSLVRLAMTPPLPPSCDSNNIAGGATHHLLPRMMEHLWKLVMLVLEVALVRKAERVGRTELTTAEQLLKPETREAEVQTTPELMDDFAGARKGAAAAGESEVDTDDDAAPQQPAEKLLRLLPGSPSASASAGAHLTLSSLPTAFEPTRPSHLSALESSMRSYESSMVLRGPATATALTAADEVLDSLAVQHREAELKDSGLYSVGLMLQRDSLLKATERLMRENEFLKFRLRESTELVTELTERQDTALRALAEAGEDSVGIALDELDEWMEDALDARQVQMDSMARLGDLAYDYSNKHAAAVTAEATADSSHKESMDTLRRLQGKEAEISRARQAELDAQDAAAQASATAKAKAFSVMDREIATLELLTDDEIAAKVKAVSDIDTLRGMVVKLLYTKVRRHLHETPAQRAARLRKEGTPRLVRGVFTRVALSEKIMPVKPLTRNILEIYMAKIVFDEAQARELAAVGGTPIHPLRRGQTLHGFSYSWFLHRFGLRAMAESNLAEMLRSVLVLLHPDRAGHRKYAQALALHSAELLDRSVKPRLSMYARLMHLYTDAPLPAEALEFFLFLLKVTQEAAAASLPSSFNAGAASARPARESQTDTSKAMLRSLEAACVPIHVAGVSTSARAVSKRNSLVDPALLAQAGLLARAVSPTRGSLNAALDGVAGLSSSATASAAATTEDATSGSSGSIGLFVPLFLAAESVSHAFKQLGYSDDALDSALVQLEKDFVYPLNPTRTSGGSTALATESAKLRLLFKQILVRQMIRSASVGLSNPSAVWDRFDTDRSGSVSFEKFKAGVQGGTVAAAAAVDEETFAIVADMMNPSGRAFLGREGVLVPTDLACALSPDYRLALPLDSMLESATLSWLAEHRGVTERYRQAFMEVDPSKHGLINFNEFWMLVQNLAKAGAAAAAAATAAAAAASGSAAAPAAGASGSSAATSPASTSSSAATPLPATALAKQCSRPVAQRMFREGLELERKALAAKAAADALKAEKEREREAARAKKAGRRGRDKSPGRAPASAIATAAASAAPLAPTAAAPSDPASPLTADKRSVQFALPDGSDAAAAGADASALGATASSSSSASRPPVLGRQLSLGSSDFISLDSCLTLLRRYRVGLAPRRAFAELRSFCRRYKSVGPLSPPPPLSRRLSSETAARRASSRSSNGAEVLAMIKARAITTIKE